MVMNMLKRLVAVLLCLLLVPVSTPVLAVDMNYDITDSNFYKTGTWNSSGLKTQKGNSTLYATGFGCVAGWTLEFDKVTTASVYYYVPEYSRSVELSGTITVRIGDITKELALDREDCQGWLPLGEYTFYPDETNEVYITSTNKAYARATGIRVEENSKYKSYLVLPEHFETLGTWMPAQLSGAYGTQCLQSEYVDGKYSPAVINLDVENGDYYIYVHSCDYPNFSPMTRLFYLTANGVEYRKSEGTGKEDYFGSASGGIPIEGEPKAELWSFEKAQYPKETVTVTDGKLEIGLHNKRGTAFARFDGIVITQDPSFSPISMSHADMVCQRTNSASSRYRNTVFPSYGKQTLENSEILTLKNDYVTVEFKIGQNTENGKTVVQRRTVTDGIEVNKFSDGLGFLTVYAKSAEELPQAYPVIFRTTFTDYSGNEAKSSGNNIYTCGENSWIVPDSIEVIDKNTLLISGENDYAKLKSVWTLTETDKEPLVELEFTPKKDGAYSFGMFNQVNEWTDIQTEYVLMPFEYQEDRMPESGRLTSEALLTTPLSQATYKNNEYTLGVAVDPSSIEYRWARITQGGMKTDYYGNEVMLDDREKQSNFGMGLRGFEGGIQPSLFAPVMGSYDSNMKSGEVFSFAYRPTATKGDWYENYKHTVRDVIGFYDYRENYFCSMTDAAFNLYNLLLDDYYSGWDDNAKAHYNMEDSFWATNSDGLSYLQFYLLTDDKEMLEERTIPSMAYMLGRGGSHIWYRHSERDYPEGPLNRIPYSGIGSMGNSTYGGAYLMTRGQMPVFHKIATDGLRDTYVRAGVGTKLTNPSESLWMERMSTGVLDQAITEAERYMKYGVYTPVSNNIEDGFVNRCVYPHYQSMIELYEETGEQKYLDAAISAGRRALPTYWCMPMPEEGVYDVYDEKEIHKFWFTRYSRYNMYWRGNERGKIGIIGIRGDINDPEESQRVYDVALDENAIIQSSEPIPRWVASRVGLGMEGKGTYSSAQQNILLSTWAGELLRLGYLAKDELMMDFARSSVVGRCANYPGYYYREFRTYPFEADFPYRGPDTTNLYYHHIPIHLTLIQDFLFANAYVSSDGKVDFPYTRSQGYAWFNNRHFGSEPGKIYDEEGMWPWLKEGTIKVSSKQVDWIAGRKDNRCAFVFTNASYDEQNFVVDFNQELGIKDGDTAVIYDKEGNKSYAEIKNNRLELVLSGKGIVTVAVNAVNVTAPEISKVSFSKEDYVGKTLSMEGLSASAMLEGNVYAEETGYDVNAYTIQMLPETYYAYVNAGFVSCNEDAENGIDKCIIYYDNGNGEVSEEDSVFPFEFLIPTDSENEISFMVETIKGNTSKMSEVMTLHAATTEIDGKVRLESYNEKDAVIINETDSEQTVTLVVAGYKGERLEYAVPFERTLKSGGKTDDITFDLSAYDSKKLFLLNRNYMPIEMKIVK